MLFIKTFEELSCDTWTCLQFLPLRKLLVKFSNAFLHMSHLLKLNYYYRMRYVKSCFLLILSKQIFILIYIFWLRYQIAKLRYIQVRRLHKVDDRTPHESSWTPLLWAMKLLTRARKEKKIEIEAPVFSNLQSTFQYIDTCNRKLLSYGWVNFPLAYTQVFIVHYIIKYEFYIQKWTKFHPFH